MKNRTGLIAGGAVLLLLAGWSALWFAGRERIEDRLEDEIARLEAQGFEISHGERSVRGFPLSYRITYADVTISGPETGISYSLPAITGVASAENVGRVAFHFPSRFSVAMRFSEAMRAADETLPESVRIDVEAENLVVETAAPDAETATLEARADSLAAVSAGGQGPMALAIELAGLNGEIAVPTAPDVGALRWNANVDRLEYAVSFIDPSGMRTTAEGTSGSIVLSGESSLRTPEQWEAVFTSAEGTGRADFAYQAGDSVSEVRVEGGPEAIAGTVRMESGTASAEVSVGDGRVEFRGSSEANLVQVEPAVEESPFAGALAVDGLEIVYAAPIAPADEITPFQMRLALMGVEADDMLWQAIDPMDRLTREPAHLILDLTGAGRMMPPDESGQAPDPPIGLDRLELTVASLQALGASLSAEGALEFAGGTDVADGAITVRGEGLLDALEDLAEAGWLDQQSYQSAVLMSSVYARPGERDGEIVAEVGFTAEGMTVNGAPVQ